MTLSIDTAYTSGSAGTIQYSALTSDTNWVDVVDQLMELERFHVDQLNDWKTEWSDKITAIQDLDALLLILETNAEDISSTSGFLSRTAVSGDEDILTVTNTSSAVPGAHTVTVGSNVPHRVASQGWSDKDTSAIGDGGGDFVITVGGYGTITIADADIGAATTLQDLVDLINNDGENTGDLSVTAEILDDGSTGNPYRLVITADHGGPDYEISITSNPTKLNFYGYDIGCPDTSGLTATTTASIDAMGSFTEDKSVIGSAAYRTYTFTGPAVDQTIGSGDWTISWSGDVGGGSGSINLGSSYTPGDTIEVEDGLCLQFGEGVLEGGPKTFTVKAYSADIDDAEMIDWNGTSAVTTDGNYLGQTTKTFHFSVAGTESYTVGTDAFDLTWTDGEGSSGTVSVTSASYENLQVAQGVEISFGAGTVEGADTFSVNVYGATLQDNVSEGLAKAEVETHFGFVDENTTAVTSADAVFSYIYGGLSRSVSVSAGTTLEELAALINGDEDNPGVTATILNDGSGLDTAYHLQLVGTDAGAAYAITGISHTLDNFAKNGTSGYGFSETQAAQNAMLKVDGYPVDDDEYIQRDSNTIGDLIGGVTMYLGAAGTTNISVANDISAVETKIEEFVGSVNSVLDYVKEMMAYDEEGTGENNGLMIGNYAFQIVQQRINGLLSDPIPGLTDGVDAYTRLSEIGIHTDPDQDGKWVVDFADLVAALNNDLNAVSKLFVSDDATGVDGIAKLIEDETDTLTKDYADANPGLISVLLHHYDEIIENIDSKIELEERRLALVESRLNTKYSQLEILLGQLEGEQAYLTALIESLNSDDN